MPNNSSTEFVTFYDGTAIINGKPYRFGQSGISYKRHYAARTASVNIAAIIKVPFTKDIHPNDLCVINGEKYVIELVQPVRAGTPPHTVLTLTEYRVNR